VARETELNISLVQHRYKWESVICIRIWIFDKLWGCQLD